MRFDTADAETEVSGNTTTVPASIRRELDVEDGDHLRWTVDGGTIHVAVVHHESGTFADFDGDDGTERTDGTEEHDAWGLE